MSTESTPDPNSNWSKPWIPDRAEVEHEIRAILQMHGISDKDKLESIPGSVTLFISAILINIALSLSPSANSFPLIQVMEGHGPKNSGPDSEVRKSNSSE